MSAGADYLVASGVFNIKLDASNADWTEYVLENLKKFDAWTKKGFAVNFLTKYSDLMQIGQKRKNRLFLLISLLIPILASGLRYNVGTDFKNYENIYNGIVPNLDLKGYMTYGPTELGIYFISNIGIALNLDSWFMFTAFSALTILPIYYGIKNFNLKYPSTAYLLYLLVITASSA